MVLSINFLTSKLRAHLYKCSLVVVSSVPVNGLAEQSIKFLQLTDFIAFSLGHHSVQQHLRNNQDTFQESANEMGNSASQHFVFIYCVCTFFRVSVIVGELTTFIFLSVRDAFEE